MTAPVIQSVIYDDLTLYIIFDRAVSVTGGDELDGFTFTRVPGGVIVPSFSSVDENAIIATMVAPLGSDSLTVDYDHTLGTVVDADTGLDSAESFTGMVVTEYWVAPTVIRAVAGDPSNNAITIYFKEPVSATGGDPLAGFSVEVDNVAIDLTDAIVSLSGDCTEFTILFTGDFSYNNVIDVTYTAASGTLYTWPSGAVGNFSFLVLPNLSTDGLPNSAYPLSTVTKDELEIGNNTVTARVSISLNPVDRGLVNGYGPAQVDVGGTFGVTGPNPTGVVIDSRLELVRDGAIWEQDFTVSGHTDWASTAAIEWRDTMAVRIGTKLGELRATDQTVYQGVRTNVQV